MRPGVMLVIALCAPGCQVVFPLENTSDKVPHIPRTENEEPGDTDLVIEGRFSYDTTDAPQALPGDADFQKIRQDAGGLDIDVVVMRVGTLKIANLANFVITGNTPFLILARTIEIEGTIDASAAANGFQAGPGGGRPGMRDPGEGGAGVAGPNNINTGGGGGGFATGAGDGGSIKCLAAVDAGGAGVAHGDAALTALRGGGAGGSGAAHCPEISLRGGFGGGALQLSATESITIASTGRVRASGGGGGGGAGGCGLLDDAGSGGGAGGAIYLDAPRIANEGAIEAFGGGGGGGGDDSMGTGSGGPGVPGYWGNDAMLPSVGGAGQPTKGTSGGSGAREGNATSGEIGDCMVGQGAQLTFNTGGGGGAFGRIVVRVAGEVSPFGTIEPPPTKLSYPID